MQVFSSRFRALHHNKNNGFRKSASRRDAAVQYRYSISHNQILLSAAIAIRVPDRFARALIAAQ